ncbi:MAG: PEP-CTERM sorting domain-containing protein [Armatimonadota bacterium]
MKRLFILAAALTVACACSAGAMPIVFSDDFEAGLGNWTQVFPTAPVEWSSAQAASGTYSARVPGTGANNQFAMDYHIPVAYPDFELRFKFYNASTASGPRNYIQIGSWSGGARNGTLQQLYALGTYNSITSGTPYSAAKFQGRVAVPSSINWFNVDDSDRTIVGWHELVIKQDSVAKTVSFQVDGGTPTVHSLSTVFAPTSIRIGSALSNANVEAFFDDIYFVTPEPGSLLALGSGLVGMAGLLLRRRA